MKMEQVAKSIKEMQLALSDVDSRKGMLDWKLTKVQAAIESHLYNFCDTEFFHDVQNSYGEAVSGSIVMDCISHWGIRSLERELRDTKDIPDLKDRQRVVKDITETVETMQFNLDYLTTKECRINPRPQTRLYPKVKKGWY